MAGNFMDTAYLLSQGISGLGSGLAQAQAYRAQGEYNARMLILNAKLAEFQAQDALRRGDKEATDYQKRVGQLMGSQRVAYAAQGIQLGEGSAAEVASDTAENAARDVVTIRSNAWREAWGHRVQAQDFLGQADYTRIAAEFNASASEIGAVAGFVSSGFMAGAAYADSAKGNNRERNLDAGRAAGRNYFTGSTPGYFGGPPVNRSPSGSPVAPAKGYRSIWD